MKNFLAENSLSGIYRVWLRYFAVFRKSIIYGLTTTISEPLLFLLAFGFGLGQMVESFEYRGVEMTYREFVFAGMVAQAVLLQGYFEGAYGSFIRMYYQRIFQAIAVTPITLSEVLWAELLWDSTRACFSAFVILMIGTLMGAFEPWAWLKALPVVAIGAMTFSAFGVFCAGKSRTIEELNYPQYLFVFPMFLFCGIFFPIENLPGVLQPVVQFLPLAAIADLVRSITLDLEIRWSSVVIALGWVAVLVPLARGSMTKRLVA